MSDLTIACAPGVGKYHYAEPGQNVTICGRKTGEGWRIVRSAPAHAEWCLRCVPERDAKRDMETVLAPFPEPLRGMLRAAARVHPPAKPEDVTPEPEEHVHEYVICDCGHRKDAPAKPVAVTPEPIRSANPEQGDCQHCGKALPATAKRNARYCSNACRQAAYRKRVAK